MTFTDEPVAGERGAARWPAATVGYIERHHVTEHMVFCIICRNILGRLADDSAEFHFPVGPVASVRNNDLVTIADNGAAARLDEQIRNTALFASKPPAFPAFFLGARFLYVAVEINGCVKNLSRIHDRRQRSDIANIVYIVRALIAQHVTGDKVVDQFVQPALQAIIVAADEFQHVGRQWDFRIRGIPLQRAVGRIEFHDQAVAQHDADRRYAVNFERANLERFGDRLGGA